MASKTHIKDLILGDDQMDFPNNDGADGQVLTTDGAQSVTWEYPYANMNLTTLANVNAATPSDGDVLTWDSGTSKWVNEAPAATVTELDDLSDVVIGVDGGVTGSTALAPGDFFWYNGTTWRNYPAASAGSFLSNYIDLDDLDNVNTAIAGKSTGDFLKWNGSYWQADSISGVAETRLFENQGYNTVSSSEGLRYFLPGATTQGNRSTAGSETTLNPTSNGTNTWNQWKKLSHRVPSGTWTIDLNIDISMTSNSTGSGNASDYQEEDIEVRLFEVAPGVNGNCTLTQLGTTQYVTMDTTDTAEGKNLDYQVTGMSSGGRDRIVVVLKGTVSSASTRYCHWAYDLQITKTA